MENDGWEMRTDEISFLTYLYPFTYNGNEKGTNHIRTVENMVVIISLRGWLFSLLCWTLNIWSSYYDYTNRIWLKSLLLSTTVRNNRTKFAAISCELWWLCKRKRHWNFEKWVYSFYAFFRPFPSGACSKAFEHLHRNGHRVISAIQQSKIRIGRHEFTF